MVQKKGAINYLLVTGFVLMLGVLTVISIYLYDPTVYDKILGKEPIGPGHITFSVGNLPLSADAYGGIMTLSADLMHDAYDIPNPDKPGTLEYEYRMVATTTRPWVVFVRATDVKGAATDLSKVPFEVYRANLHEVHWSDLNKKIDQAEQVTHDPTTFKQFPEISSNGDVVYMARPIAITPHGNVEDWSIHWKPEGGGDRIVATGIYPKWVNEGQFVYIKSDGLYLYTLSTLTAKKIASVETQVHDDMSLYVSDDGKYIAWSVPEKKTIYVLQAVDWNTGKVAIKGAVSVLGWYPVISPDDRYVGFLTMSRHLNGDYFPLIRFIDTSSVSIVPSLWFSLGDLYKNIQDKMQAYSGSVASSGAADQASAGKNFNYIILNNWLQTRH